jgi:hypothetical protein
LGRSDEGHAAQHVPRVAALVARRALGLEQPDLLVEAQRGCGDT